MSGVVLSGGREHFLVHDAIFILSSQFPDSPTSPTFPISLVTTLPTLIKSIPAHLS